MSSCSARGKVGEAGVVVGVVFGLTNPPAGLWEGDIFIFFIIITRVMLMPQLLGRREAAGIQE